MSEKKRLNADDIFELSERFRKMSIALSDYRSKNRGALKPTQDKKIEKLIWWLLNSATDLNTFAVGLALDEAKVSLQELKKSTEKAQSAIKKLEDARKIIKVATAAFALAAAISVKDIDGITKNVKLLLDIATEEEG